MRSRALLRGTHGKKVELNMPKMKTKRGAAKRFKVSGTGKVLRGKTNRRHILTTKTKKQKRQGRVKATIASPQIERNIKRLVPYL